MVDKTEGVEVCGEDFLAWPELKDPSAKKEYFFDLTDYLSTTDTITGTPTLSVDVDSGITPVVIGNGSNGADPISHDGKIVKFWVLSGGVGNHRITLNFDTVAGITDEVTKVLVIKET